MGMDDENGWKGKRRRETESKEEEGKQRNRPRTTRGGRGMLRQPDTNQFTAESLSRSISFSLFFFCCFCFLLLAGSSFLPLSSSFDRLVRSSFFLPILQPSSLIHFSSPIFQPSKLRELGNEILAISLCCSSSIFLSVFLFLSPLSFHRSSPFGPTWGAALAAARLLNVTNALRVHSGGSCCRRAIWAFHFYKKERRRRKEEGAKHKEKRRKGWEQKNKNGKRRWDMKETEKPLRTHWEWIQEALAADKRCEHFISERKLRMEGEKRNE